MEDNGYYPKEIYKYRNWKDKWHKEVFLDNVLFFASPASFNDPFDCANAISISKLETEEKRKEYVNRVTIRNFYQLVENGVDIEDKIKEMDERLEKEPEVIQTLIDQIHSENYKKYYGVISFASRWDNLLMWSHYADSHCGYCIAFREEAFRKGIDRIKGGMVHYPEHTVDFLIDPLEDIVEQGFKEVFIKGHDWKYEEEYRIARNFYPNEPTNECRKLFYEYSMVVDITLGINFPKSDIAIFRDLCREYNIPLYQAYREREKFVVQRRLIDF